jgi:hypothetical protein
MVVMQVPKLELESTLEALAERVAATLKPCLSEASLPVAQRAVGNRGGCGIRKMESDESTGQVFDVGRCGWGFI